MTIAMKDEGLCRETFALSGPPPRTFPPYKRGPHRSVPVFAPNREDLPLQSGWYSFVIDARGEFHVQWGATRSHAGMINNQDAVTAGRFRISRIGRLAEVITDAKSYNFCFRYGKSALATYVLESFRRHPAFDLSPHCVFKLRVGSWYENESFTVDGEPLSAGEYEECLGLIDQEGLEYDHELACSAEQQSRFSIYAPEVPERLYGMRIDQVSVALEPGYSDDLDLDHFEYGEPMPRLAPNSGLPSAGKANFVVDSDGWLIVAQRDTISCLVGRAVGGAGQVILGGSGQISEIHLNYSGHYRPLLDSRYATYIFRCLRFHPLLTIETPCRILGRRFTDDAGLSRVLSFTEEELLGDSEELDRFLESF